MSTTSVHHLGDLWPLPKVTKSTQKCTLYSYQILSWWYALFLRFGNCLFYTYVDLVTYIKVKGHQQRYSCVELDSVYKFDLARYHSLWKKSNIKFLWQISVHVNHLRPKMQISRTKLVYVTYSWCILYQYQVSFWWHALFLRYGNCLFYTHVDPVT